MKIALCHFALTLFSLGLLTDCAATKINPRVNDEAQSAIITAVPFTIHDNRILVDVMLNGEGPFKMIFDTGGGNTITPAVQRALKLPSQGFEIASGAGDNQTTARSVHLRSAQLGTLKMLEQKFLVIDLDKIRQAFHFPELDGIIGFELLQRGRVRLDFDEQMLQVFEPSKPSPAQPGTQVIKFDLVDDKPLIDGKINGQPARILLDTGDRSNLTLFRKYASDSKLEELFEHRHELLTGMGVGGPIRGKIASIQKIDLGPAEVKDVLARLPMTKRGYFFNEGISASAGVGLLKAFNLEFDYQNKLVVLEPRKDFKEESTFVPLKR